MKRRWVPALAAAPLIAGCGSATLSNAQLRSQASQICDRAQSRLQRIAVPSTPGGGEAFLVRGVTALAPEQRSLRALHPPSDHAGTYDAAVSVLVREADELRVAAHGLQAGSDPVRSIRSLQHQLAPLEGRANADWQRLEIPACVER